MAALILAVAAGLRITDAFDGAVPRRASVSELMEAAGLDMGWYTNAPSKQ